VTADGDKARGVTIFNVIIGKEDFASHMLQEKAEKVKQIARSYVRDL